MISYTVKTQGLEKVVQGLREFEARFEDWEPWLRLKLEPFIYGTVAARFDAQGPGWKALSPTYAAMKAKRWPGRRILARDGPLRNSVTRQGAPGQLRRMTPRSLELGSSLPYAAAQHYGFDKRGLPPRPYLQAGPEDEARWAGDLERYVVARLLRAVGRSVSDGA